jgi:Zn-dependent M28 family amino/carboxypeptidase
MQLVASTPNSKPIPESIRGLLDAISPNDLREIVEGISVPRPTGTSENEAVRKSIIELFSRTKAVHLGVKVDEASNVVVGDPRQAKILIGAHYDSIGGTPGADDNASGVAALIAAAHAIGPEEEVCYVAFDGEECGFVGSRALVAGLGEYRPEQVHVLEMVGYTSREPGSQRNPIPVIQTPTVGDFLGLVGTYPSWTLLEHVLASADSHAIPVQGLFLPDVPLDRIWRVSHHLLRSDHAQFWEEGIPALMWTDTSEFRNPHYHQATDTPETLDYEFLAGVTGLLVHAVLCGLSGWERPCVAPKQSR